MAHPLHDNPYESEKVARAWQLINQASQITLLTHRKPDGDGVSACAAFDEILAALEKETETIYPTKSYMKLSFHARYVEIDNHTFIPDLIIAFDTASRDRMYLPDAFKDIPL